MTNKLTSTDKARRMAAALVQEESNLTRERNVPAANALLEYIASADEESLARFHDMLVQ